MCQKNQRFGMHNNGKVKNEPACAQKNANMLKKISLMGMELHIRMEK